MVIAGLYAVMIYYSLRTKSRVVGKRPKNRKQTPQVDNIRTVSQFKKQQEGGEMCLSGTFQFPMSHFFWEGASKVSGANHPPTIPGLPDFHQNFHRIWQHTQDLDFGKWKWNIPKTWTLESENSKRGLQFFFFRFSQSTPKIWTLEST